MPAFSIEGPRFGQAAVCEPVLRALPAWFGIERAILQYLADIEHLPTFLARREGQVAGFVSLKQHFPASAELLVMGVRPEAHRRGIGRALLERAQAWLVAQGVEYLQVKTLGPSDPDENYAKTRAFYQAMGFRPLEEIPEIWDEDNPCLVMVKKL
ncbi:MAG: GNAT family N-acetyltransferase [Chloroflexota bacterium]